MTRVLRAVVTLCMFSAPLLAQSESRTTRTGVYSREQASRGQQVFLGMCKNCHTPESHTTPSFTAKWEGKPLSELFQYLRDQMPKNEPGSLNVEEYADVLAYILQLNRMPSGQNDLPTEPNQMKAIRFTTKSSKPTAVRKDP